MRKSALSKFLNCERSQVHINEYHDGYCYDGVDYAIFTEEEANREAAKHVISCMPALDINFVVSHLLGKIDKIVLSQLLNNSCENCFNLVSLFIKDYDEFISESIDKYGRAYFICLEDKTEYAISYNGVTYYIYKLI